MKNYPSHKSKIEHFFKSAGLLLCYTSGQTIVHSDDIKDTIFYLDSGMIKLYRIFKDGSLSYLGILTPGDIFPITSILEKITTHIYYATISDCKLYKLKLDTFVKEAKSNHEMTWELVQLFALYNLLLGKKIICNTLIRPYTRLVFMLNETVKYYNTTGQQLFVLPMVLTQEDYATMLGTTRETVCRHTNILKKKKILVLRDKQVCINVSKLEKEYSRLL